MNIYKKKEIFIHCDLGQSRAPTLGLVYLSKRTDFSNFL